MIDKQTEMTQSEQLNYSRIAEAIDYIRINFSRQPSLDQIAEKGHLSPFHFQRMFTEWAGVSPKKFLQYISLEYAKDVLSNKHGSLFDAAFEAGLSGTGRLHDLFIQIEGMTPGEYKNGGAELNINYSIADSPFGKILVASTSKGICNMSFSDDETRSLLELKGRFPNALLRPFLDSIQQNALNIFSHDWTQLS